MELGLDQQSPVVHSQGMGVNSETAIVYSDSLRRAGFSENEIQAAVRGRVRLRRGAYAEGVVPRDEELHLLRARATLAATLGALALSHTSAALAWGLPMYEVDLAIVHLSALARKPSHGRGPGLFRLHAARLDPSTVEDRDGVLVTSASRTVVDCARILPLRSAVIIADAALHTGIATPASLAVEVRGLSRCKGVRAASRALDLASALSESPGESLTRLTVQWLGYELDEQVEIYDSRGLAGRVDFVVKGTSVVLEFDGRAKYSIDGDPEASHWAEKVRHDRIVESGYEVVHITWRDLADPTMLRHRIEGSMRRSMMRAGRAA